MSEKHENYISLDKAKQTILDALGAFDSELEESASEILYNDNRMNIVEVDQHRTNMMLSRPAGLTVDDLKSNDMYMPDFEKRFAPDFRQQDNPENYAIVDFEYDGSPRAIIWLAHEVGHALADDMQRQNGHSFRDFSVPEMEEQAYFVQAIVSRHIRDLGKLSKDDVGENTLTMSFEREAQYTKASDLFEQALGTTDAVTRRNIILHALDNKTNVNPYLNTLEQDYSETIDM